MNFDFDMDDDFDDYPSDEDNSAQMNQSGYTGDYVYQQGYTDAMYQQPVYGDQTYAGQVYADQAYQQGYTDQSYQQGYAGGNVYQQGYTDAMYQQPVYGDQTYAGQVYADQAYQQGYADQGYQQGYTDQAYQTGYVGDYVYQQGYADPSQTGYAGDYVYQQGYTEAVYQQPVYGDQMYAGQVYADQAYQQGYVDQTYQQSYADQAYQTGHTDQSYQTGYAGDYVYQQGYTNQVYQQSLYNTQPIFTQPTGTIQLTKPQTGQNIQSQQLQAGQNIQTLQSQPQQPDLKSQPVNNRKVYQLPDEDEYDDEELDYEDDRQRRVNRMKDQKSNQERQREYIKKLMPFIAVGAVAVIAIICVLAWGIKSIFGDSDDDKAKQTQETVIENETTGEDLTEDIETVEVATKRQVANMLPVTVESPVMNEGYTVDASQASKAISEEDVQSQYATIINATTGKVLATKNGGDRMNPASMTKVMTVLVASEHITDLEDTFEVTIEDTDFAYVNDLSCAGFGAGDVVPIKDLLYGAIMPSGGECCHALERYVAGSEEEFIQMMNDKVAQLGLTGTHFTNSAGIYDENHYTTLYDMAMIMKAAIEDDICREVLHEHVYTTVATAEHPEGMELSNWFMRRIEDKYKKTEVLGAKTGYVSQSGNCAVSYTIGSDETVYICATGNAHSAWRAIFDHVSLYEQYVQ